ncbi:MAG: hypothetical protein HRT36_09360 [Alphaproteobacteria bacterium]|nr:hypothetical protein [Alphaproteobacteria bacterium]
MTPALVAAGLLPTEVDLELCKPDMYALRAKAQKQQQAFSDIARKKRIFAQQTDNITKTCRY